MILTLCLIGSSFALDLETDQSDNLQDFYYQDSGNFQIKNAVGSVNNSYEIGNNTYYYDVDYEFTSVSEDFYLIIENYFENSTIQIMWRGDLTQDPTLYIQEFTMNEQGRYYFKFVPEYTEEPAKIYIDFGEPSYVGTIEYVEQKPQGFNSLMGGFVNAFLDVVSININMWRIAFYTLIFLILVAFAGLVFGASWYIHKQSQRIRESRGMLGGKQNE